MTIDPQAIARSIGFTMIIPSVGYLISPTYGIPAGLIIFGIILLLSNSVNKGNK